MRIARRSAVALAALSVCLMATAVHAGDLTLAPDASVPNGVVLTYDPATGNLSYDGNGTMITTLELKSSSSLLVPDGVNGGVIVPPFDLISPEKFFKMTATGVGSVDIGAILPAGLTAEAVMADLQIDGSILPRGKLPDATGGGPYFYVVPEPSSLALVFCGLLGLLGLRRK